MSLSTLSSLTLGRAFAGGLAFAFFLAGFFLVMVDSERSLLHVAASGLIWSLGWLVSGNSRFAFGFALIPSLCWELIQQPLVRTTWSVDLDQLVADAAGMVLAWALLAALRMSPIGWKIQR